MQVERLMAVLEGDGTRVGYIKVTLIGGNVSMRLSVDNALEDAYLVVRVNGDKVVTIPIGDIHGDYPLGVDADRLENIEAILVDNDKLIASGASRDIDIDSLMSSIRTNTKISDTYDRVSVEIESIDEPNEIVSISDDIVANTDYTLEDSVVNENENDIDSTSDSIYNAKTPFYDAISGQLEDLYARYEREKVLEDAIVGSRFARIYYDEDSYYVVGEMRGESGAVDILCYGYPGEGGDNPPDEVNTSYEWLPLDKSNTHGKGYYMMYQNAKTGDILTN